MTTTELIKLLQSLEQGASGRSREISFLITDEDGEQRLIDSSNVKLYSTGDGCAGAQLTFSVENETVVVNGMVIGFVKVNSSEPEEFEICNIESWAKMTKEQRMQKAIEAKNESGIIDFWF